MTALKLVNNTGLKAEKNLCFVNSTLQLRYSILDWRDFFEQKEYIQNQAERLPVFDEISRIFKSEGKFRTSATELRRLTGQYYRRVDICDGVQQDMEEFTRCFWIWLNMSSAELGMSHQESWENSGEKKQTENCYLSQLMVPASKGMNQEVESFHWTT